MRLLYPSSGTTVPLGPFITDSSDLLPETILGSRDDRRGGGLLPLDLDQAEQGSTQRQDDQDSEEDLVLLEQVHSFLLSYLVGDLSLQVVGRAKPPPSISSHLYRLCDLQTFVSLFSQARDAPTPLHGTVVHQCPFMRELLCLLLHST